MRREPNRTAIVLSGGGTRGAYEAGVIHYIRTMLPARIASQLQFQILSGASVGAINAAFLAATAHDLSYQGRAVVELWEGIRSEQIYRRGPIPLGKLLLRTLVGMAAHTIGIRGIRRKDDRAFSFQGVFDTQPFAQTLRQLLPWTHIAKNLLQERIDAVAICATNMQTGQTEIFLQSRGDFPAHSRIRLRRVRLSPRHLLASAALPILFPPVPIHGVYYTDGSVRLNTPLTPAVALDARRMLIIGTRFGWPSPPPPSAEPQADTPPTLAALLGKIFNAILLDRLEVDREQLDRINRILAVCEKHVSPQTYRSICGEARVHQIETLSIFPSQDIAKLVDETIWRSYKKLETIGTFERIILRILESDEKTGDDLISFFLFEPSFLKRLIELGFEDARSHHDQLVQFGENALGPDNRTRR